MIDHAHYFREQQRQAEENAAIEDMERRSAPLLWAVYLSVAAIALSVVVSGVDEHIDHVNNLAHTNDVFAQCLNGQTIGIGASGVLRCDVREYRLVAGIQP